MSEIISWEEAISSGKFVKLEEGEEKVIVVTNWKLEKADKFGEEKIEFIADVLEEDGEICEKIFTATSNRLKKKLKPIFEGKDPKEKVKVKIIKIGDKFDTQYNCKNITN